MIGRIKYPLGHTWSPMVLTMNSDGTFRVHGGSARLSSAFASFVADRYTDAPKGPAGGRTGVAFLERFAREFGGNLELAPAPPSRSGVVY